MPTLKLTDAAVQRLQPPTSGQEEYWDNVLRGFGLRVSYGGSRAWVVVTRVLGRQIRVTVGRYPAMSLAEARQSAREMILDAQRGIDPRKKKNDMREAEVNTVGTIVPIFLERHARRLNKSWRETERIFSKEVLPFWGARPISEISRRDVNDLLNTIIDRGAPTMSNRVLSAIRKFFNWCVQEDYLEVPPTYGVRAKAKELTRDRVLLDSEVRAFWRGCQELGWPFGPLFQLLLLTGQRRQEVGGMMWDEIDFDNQVWTIPRQRTKSDRANTVPLSSGAIQILRELPRTGDIVFTVTGRTPVSGFQDAKERLDRISEVTDWRLHDLRRTAASGMARLEVAPHVIEKILNHTTGQIGGVALVYNRHGYLNEKRHALQRWDAKVQTLFE